MEKKKHNLLIARRFLKNHPNAGKPTNFKEKIFKLQKLHTLRLNYDIWFKQLMEVRTGEAVLQLKEWKGDPYKSKQNTIAVFEDIYFQKWSVNIDDFLQYKSSAVFKFDNYHYQTAEKVAIADGFDEFSDFYNWFLPKVKQDKQENKSNLEGIAIYFTNFYYYDSFLNIPIHKLWPHS